MSTLWDGSWDRKRRYDRRSMSFPAPSDTKTSYARTRPTGAVPCDDGLFHIAQLRWQLPDDPLTDSPPGFAPGKLSRPLVRHYRRGIFDHFTELVILGVEKETGVRDLCICRKSKYYKQRPMQILSWDSEDEFHLRIPHWWFSFPVTIRGKFHADASILRVAFTGSIFEAENYTVDLRKSDPRCHKYQRAAESLSYSYHVRLILLSMIISLLQMLHRKACQNPTSKLQSVLCYG